MQRASRFSLALALAVAAVSLEGCVDKAKEALQEEAKKQLTDMCHNMVSESLSGAKTAALKQLEDKCAGDEVCSEKGTASIDKAVAEKQKTMVFECVSTVQSDTSNPQAAQEWWTKTGQVFVAEAQREFLADEAAAVAEANETLNGTLS
eukprot:gnl/TRDRNA2_/TRDRNA2_43042_c0_seq1.p1 gnl/TRDRNA2_/TRDRNA2_43042_c0~~gnl/TRDRNA2_/TRDRNA2_43042_c0_seq1.p1  ORF type:complete len:149 (+),score=39.85 gnl/TRDRNA2_/TRDRNA2_43042_c0_seq1:30-476(+)